MQHQRILDPGSMAEERRARYTCTFQQVHDLTHTLVCSDWPVVFATASQ